MNRSHTIERTRSRSFLPALVITFFLIQFPTTHLYAADIVVTSSGMARADDGVCTLPEAIDAANTNTPSTDSSGDLCAAGDDQDDTIVLQANSIYTITAVDNAFGGAGNNGLPAITGPLTIRGNGATLVRAPGAPAFRFTFVDAPLTLEQLTLRNGRSTSLGGAIYTRQAVTLTEVIAQGNQAAGSGGVLNGWLDIQVTDSRFVQNSTDQNGGALATDASITVTSTTFLTNSAGLFAGAISARGNAQIDQSEFHNNQALDGGGGGIQAFGALTMSHTIFISNTANGNGGGAYAGEFARVHDAWFANNHALDGSGGGLQSRGLVITATSFVSNSAWLDGGGAASYGDTWVTDVHFIHNATLERSGGGLNVFGMLVMTNSTLLSNTNTMGDGGGLYVSDDATLANVTVEGNYAGNFGGGISSAALTLTHATIISNSAGSIGGGISVSGIGQIRDVRLERNHAVGRGGGIRSGAPLTLLDVDFVANSTAQDGGGLFVDDSAVITGATFIANSAWRGGAAYLRAPSVSDYVSITNALFVDNQASALGNHLLLLSVANNVGTGSIEIRHATIANTKAITGSAIIVAGSPGGRANLTNSILANHETAIEVLGEGVFSEQYNLFDNDINLVPDTPLDVNSLVGDPGFVDSTGGDFHISASSDARDRGLDAGVLFDLEGVTRPADDGFDMGAYEYACDALTGVIVSGPDAGALGAEHLFMARVTPNKADPASLTYVWSPEPATGQGTATATYRWNSTGSVEIGVEATNCAGAGVANDSANFVILGGVYLPSVQNE